MASTIKFKITMKIPGTADLTPPELVANCEIEFPGDTDAERAKAAYYKANYEAKLKAVLAEQIKGYATPLKSMQAEIDKMKAAYNAVTDSTDPFKLVAQIDSAKDLHKQIKEKIAGYASYLEGAVNNTVNQQILIWHTKFEKQSQEEAQKKVKSDIAWKKARHIAGIVIVGILVLGAAAAAIAASIVTFGTLPVLIAGLGVASAALGGLTGLTKVGLNIKKRWDLEKASIDKLNKDLEDVAVHLGKTQSKVSGLPKHLDDASRYCSIRRENIQLMRRQLTETDATLKKLSADLATLNGAKLKAFEGKQAQLKALESEKAKVQQKLDAALALDAEMMQALDNARKLLGELEKIPFTGCRGVCDSLSRYVSADGVIGGIDSVNSVIGSAGSLAGAIKTK
jgi:chromosome segregation ATPase